MVFFLVEIWYQVFLWALFSSMFVHIIAALIALCKLRKHKIGRWIPLGIFAMGVLSPITLGAVSSKFTIIKILVLFLVNVYTELSYFDCVGSCKSYRNTLNSVPEANQY